MLHTVGKHRVNLPTVLGIIGANDPKLQHEIEVNKEGSGITAGQDDGMDGHEQDNPKGTLHGLKHKPYQCAGY